MWEYPFPEVAASIEQIESVEKVLGFSLDSELRQFLLLANGWHSFFQTIDVFSAEDWCKESILTEQILCCKV
ncbi:SMI1/KNR4 family protein [Undibacterium sp. Ji42W]|uniref:SMI1/KNR4 family protein n=1 Tax=Undibacterium sp. Ji42W TaxID=3413039 RepID=UPI003BF1C601